MGVALTTPVAAQTVSTYSDSVHFNCHDPFSNKTRGFRKSHCSRSNSQTQSRSTQRPWAPGAPSRHKPAVWATDCHYLSPIATSFSTTELVVSRVATAPTLTQSLSQTLRDSDTPSRLMLVVFTMTVTLPQPTRQGLSSGLQSAFGVSRKKLRKVH